MHPPLPPIWRHCTMWYVSPTRRGMGWAPTVAPSSLYVTSPCSLQGTRDTGVTLLSFTPLAFTPLACLATALQPTGPEDRLLLVPPSGDWDDISAGRHLPLGNLLSDAEPSTVATPSPSASFDFFCFNETSTGSHGDATASCTLGSRSSHFPYLMTFKTPITVLP